MKALAWFAITCSGLVMILTPLVFGTMPKKPIGYSMFIKMTLEFAVILALAGRVLKWW